MRYNGQKKYHFMSNKRWWIIFFNNSFALIIRRTRWIWCVKSSKYTINFYYQVRELSNDAISPGLVALGGTEISDYLASAAVSWDNTTSEAEKMNLIATQKWFSFNVIQPYENWAELRRLNAPELDFWVDPANAQSLPPNRWIYPNSELVYNTENYNAVKSNDNLSTKIFWDIDWLV